jgi:NAD(P)-dependent dehydrogenase (short-subunit alcohol dehydrogenase family)
VAPFGIHVTLIEPGGFSTDWAGSSSKRSTPLPDYKGVHAEADRLRSQRTAKSGDPQASAAAVLKIVDSPEPPLRVFFGELPLQLAKADYESRLKTWEEWQPVAVEAGG